MIYFHHIPKTGGTSLFKGLDCRKQQINYVRDRPVELGVEFVSSHHKFLNYKPSGTFITLLRDPVDMFYSFYQYFKERKVWRNYHGIIARQVMNVDNSESISEYTNKYFPFPIGWFDELDRFDKILFVDDQKGIRNFFKEHGIKYTPTHVNTTNWDYEHRKQVEKLLKKEVDIYNRKKDLC